jgi:signal recognition particle receptor subunit beta
MTEIESLRTDLLRAVDHVTRADGIYPPGPQMQPLLDRLADTSLRVVVIGEFRRGKSTLLNTLVNRNVFPVDLDVTTAVVTTLQWGDEDRAVIHHTGSQTADQAGRGEEVPLDRVRDFVTEQRNPGNRAHVTLAELYAPIEKLRSGLVLVDTPGLGSVNYLHTAATREYLANADAVIFVASATQPLTTRELGYVKDALGHTPHFITALSKSDESADIEPVVAAARSRIAAAAGRSADELIIVPVSALLMKDAVEDDDPELIAEAGFAELDAAIDERLSVQCAIARLKPVARMLGTLVGEGLARIMAELTALDDYGALARISAELSAERSRLDRLQQQDARWRRQIAAELRGAKDRVRSRLDDAFDAILAGITQESCRNWAAETPAVPVDQFTLAISRALESAVGSLTSEAADISKQYSAESSIRLSVHGSDTVLFSPVLGLPWLPAPDVPSFADVFLRTRAGTGAGTGIGYVLISGGSAILVPGIGIPVLLLALANMANQITGLVTEARDQLAREKREQLNARARAVKNALDTAIEMNRRRARNEIEDLTSRYERGLIKQIDGYYESALRLAQENIGRYEENERRTASERDSRRRDLERSSAALAGLAKRVDGLAGRVDNLGRAASSPVRGQDQ